MLLILTCRRKENTLKTIPFRLYPSCLLAGNGGKTKKTSQKEKKEDKSKNETAPFYKCQDGWGCDQIGQSKESVDRSRCMSA